MTDSLESSPLYCKYWLSYHRTQKFGCYLNETFGPYLRVGITMKLTIREVESQFNT